MKYIKAIMEPVLIFLRENDGNLKKAPGNSIGHAYFNFYQIDQFYKNSETIKPIHRTALSKILNERWVFGHNKLHSAAFVVHPFYRTYKQDQNPEVMGDFFDLLDCWCTQDVKVEVLKQLMTYRNGLGMFARSETSQLVNDPISFWSLFGSSTPELQALAIKILQQNTSASACETNWSTYDYIFNKKRNRLNNDTAEKLVFVHLRNMKAASAKSDSDAGSSVTDYLDKVDSIDIISEIDDDMVIDIPDDSDTESDPANEQDTFSDFN